jgi:hypothetical protein
LFDFLFSHANKIKEVAMFGFLKKLQDHTNF